MAPRTEIMPISHLQSALELQKSAFVSSILTKQVINQQHDVTIPISTKPQAFAERHSKRTLASFSLEGRTCVITGGARGIGLALGEALITSGADLAIVDINSKNTHFGIAISIFVSADTMKSKKPKLR
jgi:hypothetical protein